MVLIALGGNIGDREANLQTAVSELAATAGISQLVHSSFLETVAVGGPPDQPSFLNAAARFECRFSPLSLAGELHEIEARLGRNRGTRWDARTIDLDLLLYDDLVCRTHELELPHPRMTFRRFVLQPAAEVAAELRIPSSRWTISQHLQHLQQAPRLLAIAGGPLEQRARVAQQVAAELSGEYVDSPKDTGQATTESMHPHWQIVNGWTAETRLDMHDGFPGEGNSEFWLEDEFGPRPRVLAILQERVASRHSSATQNQPLAPISDTLADSLTNFSGGGVLRLDADKPMVELVAEVVAAAQATE